VADKRSRLTRLKYCFAFFFLAEGLLFILMMLAGTSRPNSGQHFSMYWFVGPFGAWLEHYQLLSDFPWLTFVVTFVINPFLYALLIYPLVRLNSRLNRRNEVPKLKI
jgi:hypothetical protein